MIEEPSAKIITRLRMLFDAIALEVRDNPAFAEKVETALTVLCERKRKAPPRQAYGRAHPILGKAEGNRGPQNVAQRDVRSA